MSIIDQIDRSREMNRNAMSAAQSTDLAEISVAQARLPQSYEDAKTALANCVSIDECVDWGNKAEALASYAKQSKDDSLMRYATRIRDRAIRRAGELLLQIKPAKGKRSDLELSTGADTRFTRTEAATEAGMSKRQAVTAVRVASVPPAEFEAAVESDKPATVTKLAEMGTRHLTPAEIVGGRDPEEFNRSLHFVAAFERYAEEVGELDLDLILPGLSPSERQEVRGHIAAIDTIHDRIATRI